MSARGLRLLALGATAPCACHDSPPTDVVATRVAREAASVVAVAPAPDAGSRAATRPLAKVTLLDNAYDFAVARPPSAAHPKGTIAALASPADCESAVAEYELATLSEMGHVCLASIRTAMVASAGNAAVVVAEKVEDALHITWLDASTGSLAVRSKATLPSALAKVDLYGLAVVQGLAVVVDDEAHALIVDERGKLVRRHTCPGGLLHPGTATVEAAGDVAVLTNLIHLESEGDRRDKPVCAFRVDGAGPTRKARLPDANLDVFVDDGALYYGLKSGPAKRLGPDLLPTGSEVPVTVRNPAPSAAQPWRSACRGITGSAVRQAQQLEGLWVVRTINCCADESPSGLFVCDPDAAR